MTVIAIFEDYQLAISDLLLTVDDPAITAVIPTSGDTAKISNLDLGVRRLVRKVVATEGPAGRAALLVAGAVADITYFASELDKAFRNQKDLPEILYGIVRQKGAIGCLEVAALITNEAGHKNFEALGIAGGSLCTHTFDATQIATTIPYFGTVRIAGSGAPDLLSWLELRAEAYATHYANSDYYEKRFHIANNIPLFLIEEDLSPRQRTIKNGVGGFYEAYEILRGELLPIGSWLTVIADIVGKGRDKTVRVRRLMYHCYRGDHLYIFSMKHDVLVSAIQPIKIRLSECMLFEIPPLIPKSIPSTWTINRVATQLAGVSDIRTVIRNDDDNPVTRRFISSDPAFPKLLKIKISGNNMIIEVDQQGFNHFASRFSEDQTPPILV